MDTSLETLETHRCFGGLQGTFRHASAACGGPMEFAVYVPPGAGEHDRRPVLWFLSGLTCTPENFTIKAGAQRVAAELGLILVMPDTSPRGAGVPGEDDAWDLGTGAGFYVDATAPPWSARYQMFSYVTAELPALVHARFPTRGAGHEAISGHSMGGHGALVAALRHPERYRSASAIAPIVAPSQVPWGRKAFTAYLGPDERRWAAYDATALVAHQTHPAPILVDQGGADPFIAEQLQPERFEAACAASGQALSLRVHPGYDHSFFFVATVIADHLRHHAAHLGLAVSAPG
ncbi:MAG: S-formylglutathione hydrolase [Deltaproteobacteria bacterium HGW-Deltaproteobacteria-14]|nr:MAG: S-formylglutathione hydrolase [Deltaproteobacteria bacterium HGW-Deltaproteobacteria-14]